MPRILFPRGLATASCFSLIALSSAAQTAERRPMITQLVGGAEDLTVIGPAAAQPTIFLRR